MVLREPRLETMVAVGRALDWERAEVDRAEALGLLDREAATWPRGRRRRLWLRTTRRLLLPLSSWFRARQRYLDSLRRWLAFEPDPPTVLAKDGAPYGPPKQHPIFERFTVDDLVDRGLGSEFYLMELKSGYKPVRPGFKKKAVRVLKEPEEVLFAPALAREGQAEEGSNGHDVGDEGVG